MIKLYSHRRASAMIELIFALVIMGLVLMSAPMLVATATQSSFVTTQQEAINEAATHTNMVMSYHWDENSADERYLDPILIVSAAGDSNLSYFKLNSWRIGTPKESSRSIVREDGTKNIPATTPANLGLDTGEIKGIENDVDDFSGQTYNLVLSGSSTTNDYIEKAGDISISTNVVYGNDSPGAGDYETTGGDHIITFDNFDTINVGSTNIKYITVTLTDNSNVEELGKTVVLQAFVCNIGGYELFKRSF